MSGGSFDYLCYKDPESMLNNIHLVKEMYEFLYKEGKNDAAREIEKYYLDLIMFKDMVTTRHQRLNKILHDVEWWVSGDSGEETFDKMWKKFLEETKCQT